METEFTPEEYALRDLYCLYFTYKGILEALKLSPRTDWSDAYEDRLQEIKREIMLNGGTVDTHTSS